MEHVAQPHERLELGEEAIGLGTHSSLDRVVVTHPAHHAWRPRGSASAKALASNIDSMESDVVPLAQTSVRTVGHGRDLTDAVTVFVTTVGASTFPGCMQRLEAQDAEVRFELIDHVAPLPAALQLMLDHCETPLFVQVDEDMWLESDAIGRLYELIVDEWPDVAIVVGQLVDSHLQRPIEGVKIHRTELVRQFPWHGITTVLERNQALEAGGYRIARRPIQGTSERMTFGTHELGSDPATIVGRYRHLELLRMSSPAELDWFESYPDQFLRRVLAEHSEVDYYALIGVMAARLDREGPRPKDYRNTEDEAVLTAARRLWAGLTGGPDQP